MLTRATTYSCRRALRQRGNATVVHDTPISTPQGGDRCCPPGATANTDSDCMPVCGNDVVEMGERCDGNCPTSAAACNDTMACTSDMLMGSACGRECVHAPVQASTGARDMCCPMGASAATDSDCEAVCGNNVVEMGERCDGNCPASAAACNDDWHAPRNGQRLAACSRQCALRDHHADVSPYGCCPMGARRRTDCDCGPLRQQADERRAVRRLNTTAGDGLQREPADRQQRR